GRAGRRSRPAPRRGSRRETPSCRRRRGRGGAPRARSAGTDRPTRSARRPAPRRCGRTGCSPAPPPARSSPTDWPCCRSGRGCARARCPVPRDRPRPTRSAPGWNCGWWCRSRPAPRGCRRSCERAFPARPLHRAPAPIHTDRRAIADEHDSMDGFRQIVLGIAAAGALATASVQGRSDELRIGLSAEPSAIDPHFHNLTPHKSLLKHIFDRLIDQDENQALRPGLALSWRSVDDSSWEFKLRAGVTFSDGSPFTANDVIYSFCRAPRVENSPSSFAIYSRAITAMTAPDPLTLRMSTAGPYPLLPNEVSTIALLSAEPNGAVEW